MTERVITVVDIGTSKLFGLVGIVRGTEIEVKGTEVIQVEGDWIKSGRIVDIESVSNALIDLIESLREQSKERIEWITVGVGGEYIKGKLYSKKMEIQPKGREITEEDIHTLTREMKNMVMGENGPDKEIMGILPQEYVIDELTTTNKPPIGMHGNTLEIRFHVLTGEINPIKDIYNCVERIGVKIDKYIYPHSWAVAKAVLAEEEKKMGCVVIDIGKGTTDIVVYSDDKLVLTESFKVGSLYIDNDLSLALHTSLQYAEYLKKNYGRCDYPRFIKENKEIKYIEVQNPAGRIVRKTTEEEISKIIYFRVKEILEDFVKKRILEAAPFHTLSSGVILSGGGAKLKGIVKLTEEIFQLPVRIGLPPRLLGLDQTYQKPEYTSGVGLLFLASTTMGEEEGNIWQKIKKWFRDWFF